MPENNKPVEIEDSPVEDEVLISYDIATYPSDYTLWGLYQKHKDRDIYIPDFQREFVWSIKQSSLLIESFLLGLPVPPIFLYVDQDNKMQVIDGQQRILSFCYYFEGYFGSENLKGKRTVFRLSGLSPKSPYHKKSFSELDDSSQRKLKDCVLRAINVRQLSPTGDNTSIYHIFERLNTGGTPLEPQEIRNCVFRGDFVGILRDLNTDSNWRSILGRPDLDRHQKDVELVLRIFSLWSDGDNYDKPMKEFLNKAMCKHKAGDSEQLANFRQLFPQATAFIIKKLNKKPFHLRGPINASTLDAVFYVVMKYFDALPKDFTRRFDQFKKDKRFVELTTIGTTDTKVVHDRISLIKHYMFES